MSREIILEILLEVLEHGRYSHIVLGQALEKYQYMEKKERAFITRVTKGTLERLLTIDAVLDACSTVKTEKMRPLIRTILRMSAYQILWMDLVPDRAACDEAVKLAAKRRFTGLKSFVNGILRAVSRRKEEFVAFSETGARRAREARFKDWSLKYSMPSWLIELWKRQYSPEVVEGMLRAFLEERPTFVRCSPGAASKEMICESLLSQDVHVEDSPLFDGSLLISGYDYIEALAAFQKGWIQVQDASSALAGVIASPRLGDFVIDVCAAPGGKAVHIADSLKGSGHVLVRDLSGQRVSMMEENIARLGLRNIETEVWDAREFDPRYEGKADLVLADLPCSGFGVIGKKPDIKYHASLKQCEELVAYQREILAAGARYVKPGGRLIYSTCTVNEAENEGQRLWFLEHFSSPGRPLWKPQPIKIDSLSPALAGEDTLHEGYLQLVPGRHPCDGFFIAAFEREKIA